MIKGLLRGALFGAAVVLAGAANVALASTFQVSPVRLDFAASRPTAVLRVSNPGAEPVSVQAQVRAWSYAGEQDVFGDTEDILINPPIFTIAPGTTQFVRVGLRASVGATAEASYRLFLEELPPASKPDEMSVRTLLRISLPVFVLPAGNVASARLDWRVRRAGAAQVVLSATNNGTAHIRLQSISLRPPGGEAVASSNLAAYLLPGQTREWKIPGAALATAERLELSARSDAGDLSQQLAPMAP